MEGREGGKEGGERGERETRGTEERGEELHRTCPGPGLLCWSCPGL